MPLASDLPSSSVKGRGGKVIAHARQPSVDGDSSQPKFPRIEDCAHFHYERVDYGRIKVSFIEESSDGFKLNGSLNFEGFNPAFNVRITCKDNTWVVRRSLAHFGTLDTWLHECVFDRKFSHLPVLNIEELETKTLDEIHSQLQCYLSKLSAITDVENGEVQIVCAPVLIWLEIDNHGRNLAPHALGDVADINIPAIAAARVVRRYQARDDDELNLDVGDMVSIIEMGVSGWWRGKQGFRVGSFPSQCVKRINSATDAVGTHERHFSSSAYGAHPQEKPIVRKHGKFMEFLRSFLDTRPSKAHLKKKGILRERVFGCDLGELLHRTDEDIPTVVADCTRFVENYGVVDGIYRVSGGSSQIRHLKYEFDSDRRPDLENHLLDIPSVANVPGMAKDNSRRCDAHSVAGLCKLYFRELPNPLLTYQLYNRFASAVTDYNAEDQLLKVHDVIQQLPPPHYRTLKHLITHLRFMSQKEELTSMHSRNLAIVWAPNLLRSREIEAGLAAFTEARVQSVVTEFLILNGDILFSEELQTIQYDAEHKPPRPRSLMILPTPKLISLEEAQARSKSGVVTPVSQQNTPLENSMSGVKLRSTQEKSSSNEKRKKSKKTPSLAVQGATNSSHTTRLSKKRGHRHAVSCSEPLSSSPKGQDNTPEVDTPSRLSGPAGWKVKLGHLLRKNMPQNMSPKQASLRRAKSCDSLVCGRDSSAKDSDSFLGFPKKLLGRAKSCENTVSSDRSHPEPQVPHFNNEVSATAQTKRYTLERLKSSSNDNIVRSDSYARCSSPFCALDTDLPSVMGENGLDFDPLSYRMTNPQSPSRESAIQSFRKFSMEFASADQHYLHMVHNEAVIAPIKTPPSTNPSKETPLEKPVVFRPIPHKNLPNPKKSPIYQLDPKLPVSENSLSTDQAWNYRSSSSLSSASETNESSNNNTMHSRSSNCDLESLTADSFSPFMSSRKSARMSAVERLGLKKEKTTAELPAGIFKKPPSKYVNDQRWEMKQNIVVPTNLQNPMVPTKLPSGSNMKVGKAPTNSRKISVQVYDLPSKGPLRRDDHYGSFIALVGSTFEKDQKENPAKPQTVFNSQPHSVHKDASKVTQLAGKVEPKYSSESADNRQQRCDSPNGDLRSVASGSGGPSNSTGRFCHDHGPVFVGTQMYQTKLQTFSPAGRQRKDYPDVPKILPRFSTSSQRHNPPPPYNSSRRFRSGSTYGFSTKSSDTSSACFPYQKHGRSYSVGDECAPEMGHLRHVNNRPHSSSSQYSATSYENRAYVDTCLFYKSQSFRMETLSECSSPPYVESRAQNQPPNPRYPYPSPAQYIPPLSERSRDYPVTTPPPNPQIKGFAYSNPSYELRPVYYKGQGRYDFPKNRRKPTLITSVRDESSSLSWV